VSLWWSRAVGAWAPKQRLLGSVKGWEVATTAILIRYKEKKFFAMREGKHRTGYPEGLWVLQRRYAKHSQTRP